MISSNQNMSNEFLSTMIKDNYDNEEYWQYVSEKISFPTSFILSNLENINLRYLIKHQGKSLNIDCLTNVRFMNKIIEEELINDSVKCCILPQRTIDYFILNLSNEECKSFWNNLSSYQQLSHDFIKIYGDKLNWINITMCQKLTLDFLIENAKFITWDRLSFNLSGNQLINDKTILLFKDYLIWNTIGCFMNVNTNTIFDNLNYLTDEGAMSIIKYRTLNTQQLKILLKLCKNSEFWKYVSMMEDLEDSFIEEYIDKLQWHELSNNYNFDKKQLQKYGNYIDYDQLSHNFNMCEEWLEELKNMKMYDKLNLSFLMELDLIE